MTHFFSSIEYIEANLFERTTPDDIVETTCSSIFRHCSLFRVLMSDSFVMSYVRKRYLSIAAQRLSCEQGDIWN